MADQVRSRGSGGTRRGFARLTGAAAAIWLVAACTTQGASPTPTASPSGSDLVTPTPTPASVLPSSSGSGSASWRILALADGQQGGVALWRYDGIGGWGILQSLPDATAIARDDDTLVIARGSSLDLRSIDDPTVTVSTVHLSWTGTPPQGSIASVDRSPDGTFAVAFDNCTYGAVTPATNCPTEVISYALVSPTGSATILTSAPAESFAPSVAWLGTGRLLVLAYGSEVNSQGGAVVGDSRVGVLNTLTGKLTLASTVGGATGFALSPDRQTIAVASEGFVPVYAGDAATWFGGGTLSQLASITPDGVAYLSLDGTGLHLAVLEAQASATGDGTSFRALVFSRAGSTWSPALSSPVPFTPDSRVRQAMVWLS